MATPPTTNHQRRSHRCSLRPSMTSARSCRQSPAGHGTGAYRSCRTGAASASAGCPPGNSPTPQTSWMYPALSPKTQGGAARPPPLRRRGHRKRRARAGDTADHFNRASRAHHQGPPRRRIDRGQGDDRGHGGLQRVRPNLGHLIRSSHPRPGRRSSLCPRGQPGLARRTPVPAARQCPGR